MAQREFALKHLPNDPLFGLVSKLYNIVVSGMKRLFKSIPFFDCLSFVSSPPTLNTNTKKLFSF
jgi:hypothetical protein